MTESTLPRVTLAGRLFVLLQYLLPQHVLSGAMFWLSRRQAPWVLPWIIRGYVRAYQVDLEQAAQPDPRHYQTFNAFFTRPLSAQARPMPESPDAIASPVDGRVSQAGQIERDLLLQAKGRHFSLTALLGGDEEMSQVFQGGLFATLYLSPSDYHRVHMPIAGRLRQTIQVPGRLFSVNPTTVQRVDRLFARNERVICLFDTAVGPMAVILVGAIFVGSIETIWTGRITPPRVSEVSLIEPRSEPMRLDRGAELGRFNMGSTVILLFGPGAARWSPALAPGTRVRCGASIGWAGLNRLGPFDGKA